MHKAPAGAFFNQRPAYGGHDKFIVNGRTGGQTQTASPAFVREDHRLIAGALRWLPGVQPADLYCLTFLVHVSVLLSLSHSPDCGVTTRQPPGYFYSLNMGQAQKMRYPGCSPIWVMMDKKIRQFSDLSGKSEKYV